MNDVLKDRDMILSVSAQRLSRSHLNLEFDDTFGILDKQIIVKGELNHMDVKIYDSIEYLYARVHGI